MRSSQWASWAGVKEGKGGTIPTRVPKMYNSCVCAPRAVCVSQKYEFLSKLGYIKANTYDSITSALHIEITKHEYGNVGIVLIGKRMNEGVYE